MKSEEQIVDKNNNKITNENLNSKKPQKYGEDIYAAERILEQKYKKVI